jgi:hypothetical protein
MTEPVPVKRRGHLGVLLITLAAFLVISPAYVAGYLEKRGKLSISVVALLSLAMFVVGAFLIVRLLKD